MTIRFDIDIGIRTVKGVLTLLNESLSVEWRKYDAFDAPTGPLETITVQYTELTGVNVRRGLFRPTIRVNAKSASTFGPMPLPSGDLAVLKAKVTRADRDQADAWAAEAGLRIAEAMPGSGLIE